MQPAHYEQFIIIWVPKHVFSSFSFKGDNNLVRISLWLFKRIHDIKQGIKYVLCGKRLLIIAEL